MDDHTKQEYEARASKVRADLKTWEADWAKTHNGKKPGRDDIKSNPSIAQKYKDYNKLRDIISGKVVPTSADNDGSKSRSQKRRSDAATFSTPAKKSKYAGSPSKQNAYSNEEELMNTPAVSRKLFSPAPISSLGPTPQRDGKVLGLFDLLVEKELSGGTPSRKSGDGERPGSRSLNTQATPSKRRGSFGDDGFAKLGRTPKSSSKKQRLNFITPRKNKDGLSAQGTPTSVSKLQFDTPAFLKRHALPTVDENTSFDAPAPLRLPRKPLVRGLSEIVASLRKVEEEQADDDLEALREAEGGDFDLGRPIPVKSKPAEAAEQEILKPDTEIGQLPLGAFDDEGLYDSPVEEGVDRDGNPYKVFKKKGQKRTTRRVNIKPTRARRPADLADGNGSDEDEAVSETQAGNGADPDADFQDIDESDDNGKKKQTKSAAKGGVKEGVKKAARKVNELAHANFQRLKLRNHGAKGGPGYNSRFRRRR